MKIAIFENQYYQVKTQFDVANRIFFKDKLEYQHFNSSQEFRPLSNITQFDIVIVDISLSSNSDMDGFDLISAILKIKPTQKILILTGNSAIRENLLQRSLPELPILMKPIDPIEIKNKIKKLLP